MGLTCVHQRVGVVAGDRCCICEPAPGKCVTEKLPTGQQVLRYIDGPPGILTQVKTFARAVARHVRGGLPKTPSAELKRRRAICFACDKWSNGKCQVCGCATKAKTAWALERCPLGRWSLPVLPPVSTLPRLVEPTDLAPLFKDRFRAVCINLDRRPDRWEWFTRNNLIAGVERFAAIDAKAPTSPMPNWWQAGKGAWGCHLSHQAVLQQAIDDGFVGDDALLVLEDDALVEDDFGARIKRFAAAVPNDWQQLYLGGQHLGRRRPKTINSQVVRGFMVNRAHAYVVRGSWIRTLADHLKRCTANATFPHHVDHRMQALHPRSRVYCPAEFIVGQRGGVSDIGKSFPQNRFWR